MISYDLRRAIALLALVWAPFESEAVGIGAKQEGADWRVDLSLPEAAEPSIGFVTPLDEGGFVLSGRSPDQGLHTIVIDATGEAVSEWQPAPYHRGDRLAAGVGTEVLLADLGVDGAWPHGVDTTASLCVRERLLDGRHRFTLRRAVPTYTFGDPSLVGVYLSEHAIGPGDFNRQFDRGGGTWFSYRSSSATQIGRFEPDCTVAPATFPLAGQVESMVNVPNARATYVVASERKAGETASSSLYRVDTTGVRWKMDLGAEVIRAKVSALAAGDALVRLDSATSSRLMRVAPSGVLTWSTDLGVKSDSVDLSAWGDGFLVALDQRLVLVAANGQIDWSLDFDFRHKSKAHIPPIRILPDQGAFDDRLVELYEFDAQSDGYGLLRISAAGQATRAYPPSRTTRAWLRLSNGRVLATVAPEPGGPGVASMISLAEESPQPVVLPPLLVPRSAVAVFGDRENLFADLEGKLRRRSLHRFDINGEASWSVPTPSYGPNYSQWSAAAGRVCHAPVDRFFVRKLICYRSSDGATLFHAEIGDLNYLFGPDVFVSPAGEVSLVGPAELLEEGGRLCERVLVHNNFSASGERVGRRVLECSDWSELREWPLTVSDLGYFAYVRMGDGVDGPLLRVFGADGELRYEAALRQGYIDGLLFDESGGTLVLDFFNTEEQLVRFDAHGNKAWVRALPLPDHFGFPRVVAMQSGWLLLHSSFDLSAPVTRLARLDADGELIWQNELPVRDGLIPVDSGDPEVDRFWLFDPGTGIVRGFDVATGTLLGERSVDHQHLGAWSAPGALALAGIWSDPTGGLTIASRRVITHHGPDFAMGRNLPVDQAAISGAWYRPDATGQGLVIMHDFDGMNASIGAAWFTFSAEPGRQGLRWYTLHGPVQAGDSEASLVILRNSGGEFDRGTTTSEVVGRATLRLVDCDELHMEYSLREEEQLTPRQGTMHLQRLTPRRSSCRPPESSVSSPLAAVTPGEGFWYQPQTSGQGLSMHVLDADGTTLAGTWFTFDPAGLADDALKQHWLTWTGVRKPNGNYALDLFRTIGGGFNDRPTRNTYRVGEAELRFESCRQALLEYRFDDGELAANLAGLSGTQSLTRLGQATAEPCPLLVR